jgi:hypothetical protein
MWANKVKPKKAVNKWHKKALLIDLRKTVLVIDKGFVKLQHVPPWMQERKCKPAVQEFSLWRTHDADCLARVQVDNRGGIRC